VTEITSRYVASSRVGLTYPEKTLISENPAALTGRAGKPGAGQIQPLYHMWDSQSEYGMILPARIG
jgi:hypothetical protein